jgi:hypothetical protein
VGHDGPRHPEGLRLRGKEIWSRDLQADYGPFGLLFGYASSPLLRDALYLQVLHGMKTDDPSYVLKIDKLTGKTIWRVERPTDAVHESPDSYTTPAWVEANGRAELVITGGDVVSGHDPQTGREYWRADVLNPQRARNYRVVASPTIVAGLIIAPTRSQPARCDPAGRQRRRREHARGVDVRPGPRRADPGQRRRAPVHRARQRGRLRARREDRLDRVRARAPAIGHLQRFARPRRRQDLRHHRRRGADHGVQGGADFEVLSSNSLLGDCSPYCLSTVAVSEGQLFMRTSSYLWAIGERRQGS